MHTKFAEALLGPGSGSPSDVHLNMWAKTASKRFIDENIPLNETISKFAEENGLNRNFVERLCEMANMYTHNEMLPNDPEKRASFGFPLADSACIAGKLSSAPRPAVKIISDYAGPPSGLPGGGPTMAEMFGVSKSKPHCGFETPDKKRIIIMIEKKAALKRRAKDYMFKEAMLSETKEKETQELIKTAVMKGAKLEDIHKVACYAGVGDVTEDLLPKTAKLLNKHFLISNEELEKVAFKAPEELIDRSVPVRVINGRNAILVSLRDLKEHRDNIVRAKKDLMGLDQEVEILHQKIKEL